MEFEELKAHLEQNPEDWDARRSLARIHYEAKKYPLAAQVISDAPEIPFDEENVLFVSTIFGMVDPEAGHQLLDKFIQASSPSAYELKARLFDMTGDSDSAASCRAAITEEPVATAPVVDVEDEVSSGANESPKSEPAVSSQTPTEEPPVKTQVGSLIYEGDGDKAAPLNMELSQPVP